MLALLSLLLAPGCTSSSRAPADRASDGPAVEATLDEERRREVIASLARKLERAYVYPERVDTITSLLKKHARSGAYDSLSERGAFAEALTTDLQTASHDKHLRVSSRLEPPPLLDRRHSRVFGDVRRFDGKVAYVELAAFGVPPELAKDEIAKTMTTVADAPALVIDLRGNGGGHPGTVALVASYLFDDEPVHLNAMYSRALGGIEDSYTDPRVAGTRFGRAKPVFVLIGPKTFSGAEEFAYDLQALKRAVIVGENSGGGAHAGGPEPLAAGFSAFIPSRRPINPVTHGDWEGHGVEPDVKVPAASALDRALALAKGR